MISLKINELLNTLAGFIASYGLQNISLVEGSAAISFPQLEPMLKEHGSQYNYTAMPLLRVVFRVPAIAVFHGDAFRDEIPILAIEVDSGRIMITLGDGTEGILTMQPVAIDGVEFHPGGSDQKNIGTVRKLLDDLDEAGL